MYDELARIEANYGCVAEYNRVMEEEYEYDEYGRLVPREYEEPSDEELERQARDSRIYERKLQVLSGVPSEFAVNLKKELNKLAPVREDSNQNDYYYAQREYASTSTLRIIDEVEKYYGLKLSKETSPYRLPEGELAISIENVEFCQIFHYSVRGLSYEQFKALFTDLDYLRTYPTMFYGRKGDGNTLILSNSSLGALRYHDLVYYGFETREGMDEEAFAVNKAEYEAHKDNVRLYDGKCINGIFHVCDHYHYIGQISADDENEYYYCEKGKTCSYERRDK